VNLTPKIMSILVPLVAFQIFNAIPLACAEEHLTLDGYIRAVQSGNLEIKGSKERSEAGELRSQEGTLLLAPTLYSNVQVLRDAKYPSALLIKYDSQVSQSYSLGVSQMTTFGLQAKLHYDLFYQYYVNPLPLLVLPGGVSLTPNSFALASPVLELTQSLWSNGMGRSTQAVQEQAEAQALSSSYGATFQTKSTLTRAESNYWRLALARQIVGVQQEALDRAKRIYNWNSEKARLHLRDNADVLQAEALSKNRELDLLAAKNEERSAARAFNTTRGSTSGEVKEALDEITSEMISKLETPKRAAMRDDVKAAQQNLRVTIAGATIASEKDLPTLDVFATLSMNGQTNGIANTISDTVSNSFTNRPSQLVGLRFMMPISGARSSALEGWQKEHIAAEKTFDQKLFDQEQGWKDLVENLSDQRKQLELSLTLEDVQKAKLENERNRFKSGRTTTYQVLLFEQDFLYAQLSRIRNQAGVLNTIAQMKLFGESL
jgi:outer membrane protein TolC